ncbi:DeoR/GlpR family DNA-binding transcription regulator [Pseudonocardia sp. N23]|uniref:DeoR/GlpR family DNA-binding transcription regulator n=1 Tax=Pseudonocardia sp. N23 TaxID=1987376 RepID=UPI000BFE0E7A|nr:DeoR/GlpR family DNA-binding transcription regulator [Pseudonocardia sp. N23]GAY09066.1 transcriptional regulator of rhamnose utilization, DeoR family [Pseudonocardia sp. N23]
MASAERHRHIIELVAAAGEAGIAQLADATGASEMTIRRDLDVLAGRGVLERYRGGARSLLRGTELPWGARATDRADVKRRLARHAAALVADGESVLVDSGTTCLEVARALNGRRLTVMALSVHALSALTPSPTLTVLAAGGAVRPGELAFVGPLACDAIGRLRVDTAVLGCCGLTAADGLTAYDLDEAAVKQAAIASARRVVVVTEGAKLGRTALARVCAPPAIDLVVTEDDAPAAEVAALTDAGTRIEFATG